MASIALAEDGRLRFTWQWGARAIAWPLAAIVVIVHLAWGDPGFPIEALAYAGLLGALAVLVIGYARPFVLPLMPLLMLRLYLAIGFPVFSPPRMAAAFGPIRLSQRALEDATLGGLIFASLVIVVHFATRRWFERLRPDLTRLLDRPGAYTPEDSVTIRILSAICISLYVIIGNSALGQRTFGNLGFVFTLAASPVISLGLLFWDMERTGSLSSRITFWSAVAFLSFVGLGTGMLGSAFEPALDAIILFWTVRGRVSKSLILFVVTGLITLNSAKHDYRRLTWGQDEIGFLERAQNWSTAIERTYSSSDTTEALGSSAETTASRLSTLMLVSQMFEWVPSRVPQAGPDAWLNLPLEFVPRIFWPDKPSHTVEFNNRYTTTFRLQTHRMARSATFTLPSIGDGWWRLGWLGVVLEGAFLGLLAGFYQGIASHTSRALTIIGAGFIIAGGPESHVLGMLASQPQYWIAMVAILWIAQGLPTIFAGARKTTLQPTKRNGRLPPELS